MGSLIQLRTFNTEPHDPGQAPRPKPIDDAELVQRTLAGDRGAEDKLVRRHAREVAQMIARLLGTHDEVEDLVQDAFLAAFERLEGLKKPSAFRGWLFRIAINKTRMVIRKKRLLRLLGLDHSESDAVLEAIAIETAGPEIRAELAEIDAVLKKLPTEQRIAWMLRHVEGHTVRDVSRLCGCSLATIKRRLAAAHRYVLEAVDEEVLRYGS